MDNFQKVVIATLLDYAEAGLDDLALNQLQTNMIFDVNFDFGLETSSSLKRTSSIEMNLFDLCSTTNLERKETHLRKQDWTLAVNSNAAEVAEKAKDVRSLEQSMESFPGFNARRGSSGFVFASGNANANVMVISEPPGRTEELESVPYSGRAGDLFQKVFASIGLSLSGTKSSGIYVLPSAPFRFVKTSQKKPSDLDLIKPFLEKHIELVSPRYLVLIGKIPSIILGLKDQFSVYKENGHIGFYNRTPVIEIEGMKSMITSPEGKRRTWNNLKLLREIMDKEGH